MSYALVGRRGDIGKRYESNAINQLYKDGIAAHRAGDLIQVWRCDMHGDLSAYDSERTRRLTDKIVETRMMGL